MEGEQGVKIEFNPKPDIEKPRVKLTPGLFLDGRIYSSQDWVKEVDIKGAQAFVRGDERSYPNNPVVAYSFEDAQGKECYLVGDGHHRTAEGIVGNLPVEAIIDASLGKLSEEVLSNPNLAAQKLAVLGIQGVWHFQVFMEKLIEVKSQSKNKKK